MAISILKDAFCCGNLNEDKVPGGVNKKCKESVFGRTVYRITYPLRQLISSLVMIPYTWTRSVVEATGKSLEDRSAYVRIPLTLLAGVGTFVGSLALGTAVSSTAGLIHSVHKAAYEERINQLDTLLEGTLWNISMKKNTSSTERESEA